MPTFEYRVIVVTPKPGGAGNDARIVAPDENNMGVIPWDARSAAAYATQDGARMVEGTVIGVDRRRVTMGAATASTRYQEHSRYVVGTNRTVKRSS